MLTPEARPLPGPSKPLCIPCLGLSCRHHIPFLVTLLAVMLPLQPSLIPCSYLLWLPVTWRKPRLSSLC